MDHLAAQATFIEVAFGVNTVFSVFPRVREWFIKKIEKEKDACIAKLKASEAGRPKTLNNLRVKIEEIGTKYITRQGAFTEFFNIITILVAGLCIVILYFDLLDWMGHYNGLLLLPIPLFIGGSLINMRSYTKAIKEKLNRYNELKNEFQFDAEELKAPIADPSKS